MKHLLKALALGSTLAALAPLAHADQISFTGIDTVYNTATSTQAAGSVVFDNTQTLVQGASTGMFAEFLPATFGPFVENSIATFNNFNYLNYTTPFLMFNVTAPDAETLSFTVLAATTDLSSGLVVKGSGSYSFAGPDGTFTAPGTFQFSTQTNGGKNSVTFSDTNNGSLAATPEPSSLILLGTGVLGAAGMLRRRFSGKSNA